MAIEITNIVTFLSAVEELGDRQMFRGQGDIAWPVIPTLARRHADLADCGWHFDQWGEVEEHLLDEFKRLSAPWLNFAPQDRFEWLVIAQHHGLSTVLLDMTSNPLKALFFSVENPDHDPVDGVVYGFDPPFGWYTSTANIKVDEDLTCFYAKHINPRIVSQEACFIAFKNPTKLSPFAPLTAFDEGSDDPNGWLDEIRIPQKSKPKLRRELAKMGITHQTMFPGLDGIATTIRRSLQWK